MVVGIGIIDIFIAESRSLKEKRAILRSVLSRTKNKFNISIAEIEEHDNWKVGRIGFSVVGNERGFVNSKVDKVIQFIEHLNLVEVINSKIEISNVSEVMDGYTHG
ncbi:MAG: DUF503 domain-containing protein [Thermodesulfobacteriota bacterium]|nr:DUF503 domain-containing protein [Thermodesulfobacteriota bacterium]